MLHEDRTSVDAPDAAAHAEEYRAVLAEIVEDHGVATVAEETGVDEAALRALTSADSAEATEIDLEDAAAIQALDSDLDAETIHAEACDNLLLGMSMAVLDVDTIAVEYEGELSGTGIQQRLERRAPMTLAEFARIEHFVASRR
jgi:dephospho-CoA kinase